MTRAKPLLRVEDGRLLAGRGRFVDDVDLPGQLWLRVVRSQVAHANLLEVDTGAAHASERVHAVLTAADLPEIDRIPVRVEVAGQPLDAYLQPVLARERVRYVGEPVAVVLAEDPYAAEDAAELVAIEYEELPAVLDLRAAERAAELEMGYGDVEAAFANAAHVTRAEFTIGRHSAVPLETRGLLAAPRDGRLEIWGTTKVPHGVRAVSTTWAVPRYAGTRYGPGSMLSVRSATTTPWVRMYAPLSCHTSSAIASNRCRSSNAAAIAWVWCREWFVATRCSERSSIHFTGRSVRAASHATRKSSG